MTVIRGTHTFIDQFDRAQALTTTPGHNGWTAADTSSSGTPTYLCTTEDGGSIKLACDNTSEAQIVTMYQNNVLFLDVDNLQYVKFLTKASGIDSATTLVIGLAGARNDVPDSAAQNCWFRIEGSASTSALVAETDDGTTDNDDVATGASLASVYKELVIDFTYGKSDIRFFVDGNRVAKSTTFSMAAYTGQLQPIVQLQKASGTGTPSVQIARYEHCYNFAYGQ